MSWKNIKSFLIILFLIINLYLVFSQYGFNFKSSDFCYVNKKTLSDSISIIKKNYNVIADKAIVPEKVKKLGIIDVTNIIYTKKFEKSGYGFKTNGANFEVQIETDTYSYNETNAKLEFVKILSDIGIDKGTYKLSVKKTDIGLVCTAMAVVEPFHIFNASISAVFAPQKINLHGSWYLAEKDVLEENKRKEEMADIAAVLIDVAALCTKSEGGKTEIEDIEYGYYVSSYDENSASKTSSAIPCYKIKTDAGIKYYYDSLTGKLLKQEA